MNKRRKKLSAWYRTSSPRREAEPLIDAYHGEMGFPLHPGAAEAVTEATGLLTRARHPLCEPDGTPLSKDQPAGLRQLVSSRLFRRLRKLPEGSSFPGVDVQPEQTRVVPYSALAMFEAAVGSLKRGAHHTRDLLLCPEPFYKEFLRHVERFGLKLLRLETDAHKNGKVDPARLREAIKGAGDRLLGVAFTMPGNPLVVLYSEGELVEIGRVLVEEKVRSIVDGSFDLIVPACTPLAAVEVEISGQRHRLFDHVLTITGLSKAYMAQGPQKIGAACCGDKGWLQDLDTQLTLTFQRETTVLATAVIANTPDSYLATIYSDMVEKMAVTNQLIAAENARRGNRVLEVIGEAKYGLFMVVSFNAKLLEMAGVTRGHELTELILAAAGLDTVSSDRVGMAYPCVRLNVHCPRSDSMKKDYGLTKEIIRRLFCLADRISAGLTYVETCHAAGLLG
jgi:aspartate/methionine/tyrosine aminotransferase